MNRFTFIAILIVLACVARTRADAPVDVDMPERGISAHRGAKINHPENTLAAFREAIWLGAQQIEIDVTNTSDGHLVIMHDGTIDRTTNGTGSPTNYTLAQLKALDAGSWMDSRFTNERIPTLAETLAIMPDNIWINVHMRGGNANAYATTMEIFAANRQHQAFLSVTSSQVQGVRDAAADAGKTALINNMQGQSLSSSYVTATIDGGFDFLQLLNTSGALPAASDIQRLKDAGVGINYYGLSGALDQNRWGTLRNLFDAGIEFPLVDDAVIGMAIAEQAGCRPLDPQFRTGTTLASLDFNVIVNPGAEIYYNDYHLPSTDALPQTGPLLSRDRELYGWNDLVEVTNATYAAAELTPSSSEFPSSEFGQNAFLGGHIIGSRWIEQTIDLSPLSELVDTNALDFNLSGWFGGQSDKNDYTALSATFIAADGEVLDSASIVTLNPQDWGSVTGMAFLSTDGRVPTGTRNIEVRLAFNACNYDLSGGLADNLSLVLSESSSPTNSVPEPATVALLASAALALLFMRKSRR